MLEDNAGVMATLDALIVDGVNPDKTMDPATLQQDTAVRMANVYAGMAAGHMLRVYIYPKGAAKILVDQINVRASQIAPPWLLVPSDEFSKYVGQEIRVLGEIWANNKLLHVSRELELTIEAGFEGDRTLNLLSQNYGVVQGKPPANPPRFTRFIREATWGAGSYTYTSSDAKVATVNQQGEVTAIGNGTTTISATDSLGQTQSYLLIVTGILIFHFLTSTATWHGAGDACATAGLQLPTADQLIQLIATYPEHAGSLTDYFQCLPYGFWTGDLIGASTASTVSLDNSTDNDLVPNPSAADLKELLQVMGVSQG